MSMFNLNQLTSPRVRAYLYRVLVAAGVVAVFYGVISEEEAAVLSGLVATLFAVPAYNTPTRQQ